jgi:hypothetical protein
MYVYIYIVNICKYYMYNYVHALVEMELRKMCMPDHW